MLARTFVIVLALAAAASPAASLEHSLDHLEQLYAADTLDTLGGLPSEDVESGVQCDLCNVLTTGRVAVVVDIAPPTDRVEAPDPVDPVASWLLPRPPQRSPESQRAPPLG